MSGMDDRARQFKAAAEMQPTGAALKKEVNTLRRFLFRNQEYRFTKAAQQALYMAVLAHYANSASHHASGNVPATLTAAAANSAVSPSSASGACLASASAPSTASSTNAAGRRCDADDGDADGDSAGMDDGAAADAPVLRLLDDALKMPFTVFSSAQKDKLLALYWAVLGASGSGSASSGATAPSVTTRALSLMDIVDIGKSKAHLSLFTDDGDEYAQEVLVDDAAVLQQLKKEFNAGNAVTVVVRENDNGACFVSFAVEED